MKYDLSLLTDVEFQKLINQLIQKQYPDKIVEEFRAGKDGGKDGVINLSPTEKKIIQSKHYLKTGYDGLFKKIKDSEINKIISLKPKEYVLATSIDLSAKESQELEDLIHNAVPNTRIEIWGYSTIESQLDLFPDIVKATIKLWAQNVDIVKRILNPGAETPFLCLQTRWKKIDKYFVPFKKIDNFVKKLNEEHVLIISGDPGIGKTTLAEYLCKTFFIDGFRIEIIDRTSLGCKIDLSNPKEKVLFYFDDFLGSNYLADVDGSFSRALVDILREVKTHTNKRFVLTSRTNILEKGDYISQEFSDFRLKDVSIPIMSVDLGEDVKANILYNHLWHSQLSSELIQEFVDGHVYNEVVSHKNFRPRLIEFITRSANYEKSGENYISFVKTSLDNPKEIWEKCFNVQLNEAQRTLIKLVVANEGSIDEDTLLPAYNEAREIFHLTATTHEPVDYPYVCDICQNSLLKRFRATKYDYGGRFPIYRISTFNPSVNDFVIPQISNSFELERIFNCLKTVECIRSICSLQFDYKGRLLINILDSLQEYTTVKLIALRGLMKISREGAKKYVYEICEQSSLALEMVDDIIIEYIDDIDFTSFIEKKIDGYMASPDDMHDLYSCYSKSPFFFFFFQEKMYDVFFETLTTDINDILRDDDGFYDCNDAEEGYGRLNEILDNYSNLKANDRKAIVDSIDMEGEISSIYEQKMEDDYQLDDSYQSEGLISMFDMDGLFQGLLNR